MLDSTSSGSFQPYARAADFYKHLCLTANTTTTTTTVIIINDWPQCLGIAGNFSSFYLLSCNNNKFTSTYCNVSMFHCIYIRKHICIYITICVCIFVCLSCTTCSYWALRFSEFPIASDNILNLIHTEILTCVSTSTYICMCVNSSKIICWVL